MRAKEVRPEKWLNDKNYPIRILYDDNDYSVIWGKYENTPALGVRWNDGTNIGYPRQGKYPTWYVEPDFLAISILYRLLTISIENQNKMRIEDINYAIQELSNKMATK